MSGVSILRAHISHKVDINKISSERCKMSDVRASVYRARLRISAVEFRHRQIFQSADIIKRKKRDTFIKEHAPRKASRVKISTLWKWSGIYFCAHLAHILYLRRVPAHFCHHTLPIWRHELLKCQPQSHGRWFLHKTHCPFAWSPLLPLFLPPSHSSLFLTRFALDSWNTISVMQRAFFSHNIAALDEL